MPPGVIEPHSRRVRVLRSRAGLTILDVMIALMVLAILLTAIASSWFTLRSVQTLTQNEIKVHEIAQSLSERIVGANWDWIARDRPDELKEISVVDTSIDPQTDPPTMKTIDVVERYWRRYAWSWHRREFPRTAGMKIRLPPLTDHNWTTADYERFRKHDALTDDDVDRIDTSISPDQRVNPHNLIDLGLLDGPTGLPNLQVYVEYYHANMLEMLFTRNLTTETSAFSASVFRGADIKEYVKKDFPDLKVEDLIFPESPFAADDPELQMNSADTAIAMKAMAVRIIVTWGDTPKLFRHEVVLARRK